MLDDPSFRFDKSFPYGFWMQYHVFTSNFSIGGTVSVHIVYLEKQEKDSSAVAEWDTPIESISLGTDFSAG